MQVDLTLKNSKFPYLNELVEGDIEIKDGKIFAIKKVSSNPSEKKIDVKGKLVLPGVIDVHVHFREPGYSYKEDWETGSMAAAAGGVTTVLDMPNTNPPTLTNANLEEKRTYARKSIINFGFHFGSSKGKLNEIARAKNIVSVKVYMANKNPDLIINQVEDLEKILRLTKERKLPVTVHAEDHSTIIKLEEKIEARGLEPLKFYGKVRSRECAIKAMEKILRAYCSVGGKIHVCHVSTKEETLLLQNIKLSKPDITAEVTPHHLFLTEEEFLNKGSVGKVNPPLREEKDNIELFKAVLNGTISVVASDHAPHTLEEKEKEIEEASPGFPGVQTLLPLLLNQVNKGNISILRVCRITSENPAAIFNLKDKGKVKEGFDADLTVVDLKKSYVIRNEEMYSKCGWTPFHHKRVKGKVLLTIVNGEIAFDDAGPQKSLGKEVKVSC